MNDIRELQISTGNLFKELPDTVSLKYEIAGIDRLQVIGELYDPLAASYEPDYCDHFMPITVIPAGNGSFSIVDGCKRYQNLKKSGVTRVSCGIITTPLDGFSAGLLRIVLNRGRSRDIREKILFLSWLKTHCREESFSLYAAGAGFSPKDINQLIPVLTSEQDIVDALAKGVLDISLVKNILCLSADDRAGFFTTFKNLKLSVQAQREFLDWLPEIAYTENKTVREILSDKHITDSIDTTALNAPQKIDKIRSKLYGRKFPRLSAAQAVWKKMARELNPDPGCVTFEPDPFFEKNRLEIKTIISDSAAAVAVFGKLAKITAEEWDGLIHPVRHQ